MRPSLVNSVNDDRPELLAPDQTIPGARELILQNSIMMSGLMVAENQKVSGARKSVEEFVLFPTPGFDDVT